MPRRSRIPSLAVPLLAAPLSQLPACGGDSDTKVANTPPDPLYCFEQ